SAGNASWASEIKDDANLFSAAAVKSATESLNQLEKRDNLPVQIETYATVPADKATEFGKLAKSEWGKFYESWLKTRMKETNAKGVFVLITKSPGHVEYHVAKDLKQRGFDSDTQVAFVGKFLENFK